MDGPTQLHPLVKLDIYGKGDNGWHGENLSVKTETKSYHSLIVEAHRVSAALCFGFGDVLPPRCPSRIQ